MKKLVIVLASCLLAACNEGSTSGSAAANKVEKKVIVALDVADAFKRAKLPVSNVTAVSEASDTNKLLGRPGGYTSFVYFLDERHKMNGVNEAAMNSIEVFASDADAKARADYIRAVTKGVAFLTMYVENKGSVVLKFDKALLPTEVAEYRKVLENL